MEKIRWSHEAEQWLRDIYEYIAQDNPPAAEKVVSGIYDKAQLLSDFPELGQKYREEPEGDIRVRSGPGNLNKPLSGKSATNNVL